MRVGIVAPLFESVPPRLYGGTERVVYNLCCGLNDADIEVVLFASADSSIDGRLVPVVEEALRLRKNAVADPAAYTYRMLAEVAARADQFDLIHNHHDYWMLPLTRMTDTPVLTTLHGRLDLPDLPEALRGYPSAYFVSISDHQRVPLANLHPAPRWAKTVYHGLDLGKFRFNPTPGSYLAFLGRINREKRPEWAIEIARRAGVPLKIAAKIEGKEGRDYYEAFVRPRVDGKFIEYIGEISEHEKSEFLGNALALVFPIDWPEPFGLVVIESLACGTPVLARPLGSVPELLADGITGFNHMKIEVLADKVKDVARLDRKKCREWTEKRFSLERMTEDYIDVYRTLTSDHNRRDLLYSVQRSPHRDPQGYPEG